MRFFWVLSDRHTVREIDHKQFYKMAPWKGQKWRTLVATTRSNIRIVRAKEGEWRGIEVSIRQMKKILESLESDKEFAERRYGGPGVELENHREE